MTATQCNAQSLLKVQTFLFSATIPGNKRHGQGRPRVKFFKFLHQPMKLWDYSVLAGKFQKVPAICCNNTGSVAHSVARVDYDFK